ncbi:hypothetical protein BpHYR1_015796 [Brachionus plicatilis]|uniref:Uncharacterized protein n=1 Tax=Brachionus plicatilis TaxID=10195 RepID=A0A3M7T423_BRAPC|nr:hypothetical protein BpHYR1_015796 [Brachionus plicatilis]
MLPQANKITWDVLQEVRLVAEKLYYYYPPGCCMKIFPFCQSIFEHGLIRKKEKASASVISTRSAWQINDFNIDLEKTPVASK